MLTVSLLVGVVLFLALRGIADNFAAGVVIQTRQPIRLGDEIEAAGYRGMVKELNGRSVVIETRDGRRPVHEVAVVAHGTGSIDDSPLNRLSSPTGDGGANSDRGQSNTDAQDIRRIAVAWADAARWRPSSSRDWAGGRMRRMAALPHLGPERRARLTLLA